MKNRQPREPEFQTPRTKFEILVRAIPNESLAYLCDSNLCQIWLGARLEVVLKALAPSLGFSELLTIYRSYCRLPRHRSFECRIQLS